MNLKYKYASFDVTDSKGKIKEKITYTEVCEYLLSNKHNLFAKYIHRVNMAESWDCDFFLSHRYQISVCLAGAALLLLVLQHIRFQHRVPESISPVVRALILSGVVGVQFLGKEIPNVR